MKRSNIVKDQLGWVDADRYKPPRFDVVRLMTEDKKEKAGWWTGLFWDGYKVQAIEKVKKWKFYHEPFNPQGEK